MRMVFRFTKGEGVRFLSHLDLMRTFERGFRRARLPIRYSEGFNPRPRLVFADALPVGVTSRAELAYVDLEESASPAAVVEALNAALPSGLGLQEAWKLAAHAKHAWPQATSRRFVFRFTSPQPAVLERISSNAASMASSESVRVRRSKAARAEDIEVRGGILELKSAGSGKDVLEVAAGLALGSPAPKVRELVELLLQGLAERIDWEAEKHT